LGWILLGFLGSRGICGVVSLPSYFSVSHNGDGLDSRLFERLRTDGLRAQRLTEYGLVRERYRSVQDYDPVLRAHCRLDPVPERGK
jgi:hypothetical protein